MKDNSEKKDTNTEIKPKKRPIRVPIGIRNVLTAPKKDGYIRKFVNDKDGRIEMFKAAGYRLVEEDILVGDNSIKRTQLPGSSVSVPVGGGVKAVLMETKKDWYDEDQKAKQDKITAGENDMKRTLNPNQDGMYGRIVISS